MCLHYGTPYRFLQALRGETCYPAECHDRATLLAWLDAELAAGVYLETADFHPLLAVMLEGLAANHARMHPLWREPEYPFCDVVQALALVFGFVNGAFSKDAPLVPTRAIQDAFLKGRAPFINSQVFTIVRDVGLKCCGETLAPWEEQMERWLAFGGMETLLFEVAERNPGLLTIEAGAPGGEAPV